MRSACGWAGRMEKPRLTSLHVLRQDTVDCAGAAAAGHLDVVDEGRGGRCWSVLCVSSHVRRAGPRWSHSRPWCFSDSC